MHQRTFVMIKPDGVKRSLIGEIIATLERAGLQITRLDLRRPTPELVEQHYPNSPGWLRAVGQKTLDSYTELDLDIHEDFGTDEPLEIGKAIKQRLVTFICSGDVVAMLVEGNLAISNVRRLCGNTLPNKADPASIRGRYGIDSPDLSVAEKRPVYNLVHASGDEEEAASEIKLWFGG